MMKKAAVLLLSLAAPLMLAQELPHIGYVFPAGGRIGTTFEVRIGGQFLGGATNVHVSGGGVQAVIKDYSRPMTQREFNELRKELEELREKRETARGKKGASGSASKGAWTAADERAFNQLRARMAAFQRRPANPAIAETLSLRVTVEGGPSAAASPGNRELRLQTANGLSNLLLFNISQLPEVASKPAQAIEEPLRARFARPSPPVETPDVRVSLPVIANGQIMPGEVDRYKFRGRAGEKLVLAVSARELIPYLPDAVPGWFQATLAIYDTKGSELAYDDDFRFNPDPVLFFKVPKDGDYIVEIKDSVYRGREDFVYRLSIGELPFLTSIFPLGGKLGTDTDVETKGWNLPTGTLKVAAGNNEPVQTLVATQGERTSNPLPFARDTLPDCAEQEPNDDSTRAQQVSLPSAINGRISPTGDTDVFRFAGKRGMEVVAEVIGRRVCSPLDSVLRLTDASGKQMGLNDDFEDKGAGLITHQADSLLCVKLPQDGVYFLHIGDAQRKGGDEYAYRLRVSTPEPDFDLRVVPSSVTVRPGASTPLTVYALRKNGFTNQIILALDDVHGGFSLGGARIPPNSDQVRITLTAPSKPQPTLVSLQIEGRGVLDGKVLTRPAIPSEDMMQAFFYRHLVPSKELLVCVNGSGAQRWSVRLVSDAPVRIPSGGTARVRIAAPKAAFSRARLELSNPPEGISIQEVGTWASGAEIVLACDADKAKPGQSGNLIVEPSIGKPRGNRNAGAQYNPFGSLPAIPFEIVAP